MGVLAFARRAADVVDTRPRPRRLAVLAPLAIATALAMQVTLQLCMSRTGHPLSLFQANLVSDPAEQRGYYTLLQQQGTYDWFVVTELVDMLWAASLIPAVAALIIAVGRGHPRGTRWRRVCLASVVLAPVIPSLDLLENSVHMVMLADPAGFPDVLAPLHSGLAWTKHGAMAVLFPYFAVHIIALAVRTVHRVVSPGAPATRVGS